MASGVADAGAASVAGMQVLAVLVACVPFALAVGAIRARRNVRSCCGRDASCDLRMRAAFEGPVGHADAD